MGHGDMQRFSSSSLAPLLLTNEDRLVVGSLLARRIPSLSLFLSGCALGAIMLIAARPEHVGSSLAEFRASIEAADQDCHKGQSQKEAQGLSKVFKNDFAS